MPFTPGSEDELSEKQLKWGVWWLENRIKVKRAFIVALGIVAFVLFAYGAWGYADWFLGSGVRERAEIGSLTQSWTDYGFFREQSAPTAMVVQAAQVLPAGESRWDLIAKVQNPNHRWNMEFDFQFVGSNFNDRVRTAYVLPTETKHIYSLGFDSDVRPAASLEVIDVRYKRVDNHVVRPDYLTWAGERLNFRYENIEFTPSDPTAALPISRASFQIYNDSAFGLVEVPFFVTLYSGGKIVGVNRVLVSELHAGEMRGVEATWFNDLPNVTRVEVQPEVNILDEKVFMKPGT